MLSDSYRQLAESQDFYESLMSTPTPGDLSAGIAVQSRSFLHSQIPVPGCQFAAHYCGGAESEMVGGKSELPSTGASCDSAIRCLSTQPAFVWPTHKRPTSVVCVLWVLPVLGVLGVLGVCVAPYFLQSIVLGGRANRTNSCAAQQLATKVSLLLLGK